MDYVLLMVSKVLRRIKPNGEPTGAVQYIAYIYDSRSSVVFRVKVEDQIMAHWSALDQKGEEYTEEETVL